MDPACEIAEAHVIGASDEADEPAHARRSLVDASRQAAFERDDVYVRAIREAARDFVRSRLPVKACAGERADLTDEPAKQDKEEA